MQCHETLQGYELRGLVIFFVFLSALVSFISTFVASLLMC